jgi:hypothetical protein
MWFEICWFNSICLKTKTAIWPSFFLLKKCVREMDKKRNEQAYKETKGEDKTI